MRKTRLNPEGGATDGEALFTKFSEGPLAAGGGRRGFSRTKEGRVKDSGARSMGEANYF